MAIVGVEVGTFVEICGLEDRKDLNGKQGIVEAFVSTSESFKVFLSPSAESVGVKPKNLKAVEPLVPDAVATAELVPVLATLCSGVCNEDPVLADACSERVNKLQHMGIRPVQHPKPGYPMQHCAWEVCIGPLGAAFARGLVSTMTAHLNKTASRLDPSTASRLDPSARPSSRC